MVNRCSVCMNNSLKNADVSFFLYPKECVRRCSWLRAVGRQDLIKKMDDDIKRKSYRICDNHFPQHNIKWSKNGTLKYLTLDAFPTRNLPRNKDASTSSEKQCSSTLQNRTMKIISDHPVCGARVNTININIESGCRDASKQTDTFLSADTSRRRRLSEEIQQNDMGKVFDLNSVSKGGFLKLCEKFLSKGMLRLAKWQIDLKKGNTGFRFPKDPILRETWARLVRAQRNDRYWRPTANSFICSDHFAKESFYVTNKGYHKIKRTAIPNIEATQNTNTGDVKEQPRGEIESTDSNRTEVTTPTVNSDPLEIITSEAGGDEVTTEKVLRYRIRKLEYRDECNRRKIRSLQYRMRKQSEKTTALEGLVRALRRKTSSIENEVALLKKDTKEAPPAEIVKTETSIQMEFVEIKTEPK